MITYAHMMCTTRQAYNTDMDVHVRAASKDKCCASSMQTLGATTRTEGLAAVQKHYVCTK